MFISDDFCEVQNFRSPQLDLQQHFRLHLHPHLLSHRHPNHDDISINSSHLDYYYYRYSYSLRAQLITLS